MDNILEIKLEALHNDVSDVKTALNKLSEAITKLALVEQQQGQMAASIERAFKVLGKVEDRVSVLETQHAVLSPKQTEMAKWLDRGIMALAGAGAMMILKVAGLG